MSTIDLRRTDEDIVLLDPLAAVTPLRKRAFDVLVSVPLCLVALPVVLVLAAILAVQHRASPFFFHDRIGQGGRLFSVPKLRTLAPTTHPYADKTLTEFVLPSRLAQFLRRTHLDELPQLFLVPIGRMSLVGPRPRMEAEAKEFGDPEYDSLRISVPQGCTGLWQIGAHKHGRVSDSPEYDEFYVKNRSLRLDLWILWRTLVQAFGSSTVDVESFPTWAASSRGGPSR